VKRREFITLLGGAAAAWPLAARTQQPLPVVGVLSGFSPAGGADTLASFRQGLSDTGYVEHQNLGIEYRWAEGRYDRLPAMAPESMRCSSPQMESSVSSSANHWSRLRRATVFLCCIVIASSSHPAD